jgi:hypothetical protein
MSEGRELKKFTIYIELVHCPKEGKIVESAIACFACSFFERQDWDKVICTYKDGEEKVKD